MNEVKQLYRQLKERLKQVETYLFLSPFKLANEAGYLGSERQTNDTENLHGFVDFVHELLNEFDNEFTTPGLVEMKGKIVALFTPVIKHIESHQNWSQIIERDIELKSRVHYVRMIHATRLYKKNGRPTDLSIQNQIRYLYNFLICVLDDLKEPVKEPELPPIDATLKSAANYVVLLHDLGILEHLKTNYPLLPAQRLGELCQMITGKTTDYFREAIGSANPEKTRAFTDTGRREIESKLALFGIEKQAKKGKH